MLIVGSGNYVEGSPLPAVSAVADTVDDLKKALVDRCGVRPDNLVALLDPTDPRQVDEALAELAGQATDVLVFYYIGHGLLSAHNELYLATSATDHLHKLRYSGLSYQAVSEILGNSKARSSLVVLDCCFGGRARGSYATAPSEAFQLAASGGSYLLTASAAQQQAYAPVGERYTAFTGAVLRLLTDGDLNEPKHLTLDGVYRHLRRKLPAAGFPAPQRHTSGTTGDRVLARNPATPEIGPRKNPASGDQPCPYRGLDAYTADDTEFFHGRTELVNDTLDRLAELVLNSGPIATIGVSGVGKSSLLQAGVLPAIARGDLRTPGSSSWPQLTLTPGGHPLTTLAGRLAQHSDRDTDEILGLLRENPTQLGTLVHESLDRLAGGKGLVDGRLLLLVDQFEEVFTNCEEKAERDSFISALCTVGSAAVVIICLRADFYSHCLAYPSLKTALTDRLIVVTPMTEDQLRAAIDGPALIANLDLEEGLTNRLLHDQNVGLDITRASLPLLSYALQLTWARREGNVLTLAGYEATGTIWSAVTQQADLAYNSLDPAGQNAARILLLSMVHLGTDTDDTRHRVDVAVLIKDRPDQAAAIEAARDALIERRLVTLNDDGTAQLAHDALLRAWPQLQHWIDEDRQGLLVRQQLANDAEQWHNSNRDESLLYRGARLSTTEPHTNHAKMGPLGTIETQFLAAGTQAERRRTRQRRAVTGMLMFLVVALTAATLVAFSISRDFARQRDEVMAGVARELSSQSERLATLDPVGSRVSALAAWRIDRSTESYRAILDAAHHPAIASLSHPGQVDAVAFSLHGGTLATVTNNSWSGSTDRELRLWDVAGHQQIGEPLTENTGEVESIALSPDGKTLATGEGNALLRMLFGNCDDSIASKVQLWDLSHRRSIGFPGHRGGVLSLAFSHDGRTLATGDGCGAVRLWDVDSRKLMSEQIAVSTDAMSTMQFSPDSRTLATVDEMGAMRLWEITDERQLVSKPLPRDIDGVLSIAFADNRTLIVGDADSVQSWDVVDRRLSGDPWGPFPGAISVALNPDRTTLIVGGRDDNILLWDIALNRPRGTIVVGEATFSMTFSPDGKTAAITDDDYSVRLWDLTVPQPSDESPAGSVGSAGSANYLSVVQSPVGNLLAIADSENKIRLWNVADEQPFGEPLVVNRDTVPEIVFSPDGKLLAISDEGGGFGLWNVADQQPIGRRLSEGDGSVSALAFSPDSKMLAAGDDQGSVRLWNVADQQPIGSPLTGHTDSVTALAFSRNGTTLATAGFDETVQLWDIVDRRPIGDLLLDEGPAESVAFSPDGEILATAGRGRRYAVQLWNVTDREMVQPLTSPGLSWAQSIQFSRDGKTVVAADGSAVYLWDLASRAVIGKFLTVPISISTKFSDDGKTLSTASAPGNFQLGDEGPRSNAGLPVTVQSWDISYTTDPDVLLCESTATPFSREQWDEYVPPGRGLEYRELCP
ncbi:caspase family protein [Nocardia sp. NPDC050193]